MKMRKISSLTFALVLAFLVSAQTDIVISFDINQNGSQLVLDSVLIENQTNSTDTIIRWPNNSLEIDMLSSIEGNVLTPKNLQVQQNYPNPFSKTTIIDVYNPKKSLTVNVFDNQGKHLLKETFEMKPGFESFEFSPGADSQYVVSFSNGSEEKSIKMIYDGNGNNNCSIKLQSSNSVFINKALKDLAFTFTDGDELAFTAYTTACYAVETSSVSGSPSDSFTYTFDFTHLTDLQPDSPARIPATVDETSLAWSWTNVDGATGYKFNTVNDYETATDNGSSNILNWTDLSAGINYSLYVWAYNDCGVSFPLHIIEATTTTAFTQDEIDLITSGTSGQDFTLMDICVHPDSVILRSQSINVNLDEGNLILLKDRMKTTVVGEGVGIAAPQIGINRNVIWVQRYDKGTAQIKPWEVYYNPVITAYSDTVALRNDGCLSVPGDCVSEYSIVGNSYRALWVDVQYYDVDGNFVQERINHQYTAHIFQHEIDHLNGIMFFDRQVMENPDKFVVVDGESYGDLPKID